MILARCETGWHGICTLELNRETNCAEHDLAGTNRGEDRHTRIHSLTHPHTRSLTHTHIYTRAIINLGKVETFGGFLCGQLLRSFRGKASIASSSAVSA